MSKRLGALLAVLFCGGFIVPPSRYECRHGDALVSVRPRAQVEEVCEKAGAGEHRAACTIFYEDAAKPPRIVIPPREALNVSVEDYGQLIAHELAHACGGWPADHPR